ncbi:MAG: polyol transport system substrate-binding protein [Solirubrobacteraceae bacterium]|nr:polyol transport system substrate-binding protein [Solirubrobacteraceae bacterium]
MFRMRHKRDVAGSHTLGRWSEVQGRGVLRLLRGAVGLGAVVVTVAGCGSSSSSSKAAGSSSKGGAQTTIRVAVVSNPNMINIEKLTPNFEKLNPGIKVVYDTLNENNERSLIETDITTHANQFNAVMISNYETPIWAHNGWLVNLSPQLAANPSYDVNDLLKPIASSLTYNGGLYGVPFYGESSMVYYRKDLFKAAGLKMPLHPTWTQIASFAAKLNNPGKGTAGICLRGMSGWGENLAALDTVINTSGGSWFNPSWRPQLSSPADTAATNFYVNLVRKYGEPGASNDGFTECESSYGQGKSAMWYDATVAAGLISTSYPKISANTGYAYAPTGSPTGAAGVPSGWLYTWSLSIPKGVPNQAATVKYLEWATGKQYIAYSGPKIGWANIDPGTRTSTYGLPQYKKAAGAFAGITLASINGANPNHPTNPNVPVPYTGVQFVDQPWFIALGTQVSQQIAAAIAGTQSVGQALSTSQSDAQTTVSQAGLLK